MMDIVFDIEETVFNYRVAAVWIENNHVLIHKDRNDENWSIPGGRVKIGEDTRTSIRREMQEELGIAITVNRTLWIAEHFFKYRDQDFHEMGIYYSISTADGLNHFRKKAFHGLEGDRLIYQWVPIDELEKIILYPVFLTAGLKNIPTHTEHLIVKDE
ncbi:NUDIX hydrolase [Virgibacillus sp. FSP13]